MPKSHITRGALALFLALGLHLASSGAVLATVPGEAFAAPLQVGEHATVDLVIDYLEEGTWQRVIHHPDAAYIKVRFAEMKLRPGDTLTVSDPAGRMVHTYPGAAFTTDGEPGFWALSVIGDTAVVELHPRAAGAVPEAGMSYGARIDRYAHGYPDGFLTGGVQRSTCGTNQRTDVVCYEKSHPVEYDHAFAVARILVNGSSHCTGWRVGSEDHLMTNEHCISSQFELDQMEFWFDYRRLDCGGGPTTTPVIVTGNEFMIDDFELDFALVTLNDISTVEGFGFLELDVRLATVGERIYIPQHGAGNPKEFGIESDVDAGGLCTVIDDVLDGRGIDTDTGYWCDTTGGSSGSPVLAGATNKVIALHHFGTGGFACDASTMNSGTRIDRIWPIVEPFLAGALVQDIFIDGFESGDLSAWSNVIQ